MNTQRSTSLWPFVFGPQLAWEKSYLSCPRLFSVSGAPVTERQTPSLR